MTPHQYNSVLGYIQQYLTIRNVHPNIVNYIIKLFSTPNSQAMQHLVGVIGQRFPIERWTGNNSVSVEELLLHLEPYMNMWVKEANDVLSRQTQSLIGNSMISNNQNSISSMYDTSTGTQRTQMTTQQQPVIMGSGNSTTQTLMNNNIQNQQPAEDQKEDIKMIAVSPAGVGIDKYIRNKTQWQSEQSSGTRHTLFMMEYIFPESNDIDVIKNMWDNIPPTCKLGKWAFIFKYDRLKALNIGVRNYIKIINDIKINMKNESFFSFVKAAGDLSRNEYEIVQSVFVEIMSDLIYRLMRHSNRISTNIVIDSIKDVEELISPDFKINMTSDPNYHSTIQSLIDIGVSNLFDTVVGCGDNADLVRSKEIIYESGGKDKYDLISRSSDVIDDILNKIKEKQTVIRIPNTFMLTNAISVPTISSACDISNMALGNMFKSNMFIKEYSALQSIYAVNVHKGSATHPKKSIAKFAPCVTFNTNSCFIDTPITSIGF